MIYDGIHCICDCPTCIYDIFRRNLFRSANLVNLQFMDMTSKDKYTLSVYIYMNVYVHIFNGSQCKRAS